MSNYSSYHKWRHKVKKAFTNSLVYFDGNKDQCEALIQSSNGRIPFFPFKEHWTIMCTSVGAWNGEAGTINLNSK